MFMESYTKRLRKTVELTECCADNAAFLEDGTEREHRELVSLYYDAASRR